MEGEGLTLQRSNIFSRINPKQDPGSERTLFYNITNQTFQLNTKVTADKLCNGFTVVNTGAVDCFVNGIPLAPPVAPSRLGESVSFGGNKEEIYIGRIEISFTGGVGSCVVSQKVYIDFERGKPFEL